MNRKYLTFIFIFVFSFSYFGFAFFPYDFLQDNSSIKANQANSTKSSSDPKIDSLLWKYGTEYPGEGPVTDPRLVKFDENGEEYIVFGTDEGIVVISKFGDIVMSYRTDASVIAFDLIEDISGDGFKDIALITYTAKKDNVMAISSDKGILLWNYKRSSQTLALDAEKNPMIYQQEVDNVWDIEKATDINSDGISEILIASTSEIIMLDGATGGVVWVNSNACSNNVWRLEYSNEKIIAGSENGELVALNLNGQQLWKYQTPPSIMYLYISDYDPLEEREVPNSIDDIAFYEDIDNDGIEEIVSTADDGFIRINSGRDGTLLDKFKAYDMADIERYNYPTTDSNYPYNPSRRLFGNYGLKLSLINDFIGTGETYIFTNGFGLENYVPKNRYINFTIARVNPLNQVQHILDFNISVLYDSYSYPYSNPLFRMVNNSLFMYMNVASHLVGYNLSTSDPANNYISSYSFFEGEHYSDNAKTRGRLIPIQNIGPQYDDTAMILNKVGSQAVVDIEELKMVWSKNRYTESNIEEWNDISGDGNSELLFKKTEFYLNKWISQSDGLITEVGMIDSTSGEPIWEYNFWDDYSYRGFRNFKAIGDINEDGISDFAGLIVPTYLTDEITEPLERSGMPPIEGVILYNCSRILFLNGKDGSVLGNFPAFKWPYDFMRSFSYNGTYENPLNTESIYNDFYLRSNAEIDSSWISDFNNINWENYWDPQSLLHPDSLFAERGQMQGEISNLNQYQDSISFISQEQDNLNEIIVNMSIPLNYSNKKMLGFMDYPLSQLERIAALKLQSELSVNDTSVSDAYSFTYEIFNSSSQTWIPCSWNESNRYWNSNHLDLHGDYGNYRTNSSYFEFANTPRRDDMYVITRGVKDNTYGVDTGIEFDFENKTSLSNFITSRNRLNLRINITNSQKPFNVTFQSLGVGAFYWGLFGNQYDPYYVRKLDYVGDTSYKITNENLLKFDIENFEVLNCPGHQYDDIMFVAEDEEQSNLIGTRFILIDPKTLQWNVLWDKENLYLPFKDIHIINLNYSYDNWIISGRYKTNNIEYYAHKKVNNTEWKSWNSFMENYSFQNRSIDFGWTINCSDLYETNSSFYEVPTLVSLTNKKFGIVIGDYDSEGKLQSLVIRDTDSRGILSSINTASLDSRIVEGLYNKYDLREFIASHKLLLGKYDINGNGYNDLIGIYNQKTVTIIDGKTSEVLLNSTYNNYVEYNEPTGIPVSLVSDSSQPNNSMVIVGTQTYVFSDEFCKDGELIYYESNHLNKGEIDRWNIATKKCLPTYETYENRNRWEFFEFVTTIGDFNQDNKTDLLIGRNLFYKSLRNNNLEYKCKEVSEIVDPYNKEILIRFPFLVDSFRFLEGSENNSSKPYLIEKNGVFYCMNQNYKLEITNIHDKQVLSDGNFIIKWNGNIIYDYVQIQVDNIDHLETKGTQYYMTLGPGWHSIQMLAYDKYRVAIGVYVINVFVRNNFVYSAITLILLISSVGLSIVLSIHHRRNKKKVLIDIQKKRGRDLK